jgi:NAD-dependent deacetylase sirtuin 5
LSNPDVPPLFITQNYDSLSLRALQNLADSGLLSPEELDVAKERLIEMHGSAFKTTCLQCKHVQLSYETLLSPALSDILPSEEALAAAVSSDSASPGLKEISVENLPRCGGLEWNGSNRYGRCGGLLRPRVVWFGEVPEGMGEIARALNWTDVLIVVGTSSLVCCSSVWSIEG